MNELFQFVEEKPQEVPPIRQARRAAFPYLSVLLLVIICGGCLLADVICQKDPSYLDLMNYTKAPNREFLFGTDTLGRDLFSCIWHGGRISLTIGLAATALSTVIAVLYGSVSAIAPAWLDEGMMRLTEMLLSVPNLLLIIFLQAILGNASVASISVVIGLTSWCSISKVIRTEVKKIQKSEYVLAARCMGGGFFYLLRVHFIPNFISPIMFMVVMNVCAAIVAESTLSFMGIGLPIETISWGSMLSLAENALMSGAWWIILIPGGFLIVLLLCITDVAEWLRKSVNQKDRNL